MTSFMMFGLKKIPVLDNLQNFNIKIENEVISSVEFTQFLGIIIDHKLSWQRHVTYISLKISKFLYVLWRLKFKLPKNCLLSLYYSLVYPHLNYCIIVWGCCQNHLCLNYQFCKSALLESSIKLTILNVILILYFKNL